MVEYLVIALDRQSREDLQKAKKENIRTLSGQFICSDWWNLKCKYYDKNLDFVILIVKTDTSIIQLEKDMNSLKNPFSSIQDIPSYVIDYDYYTLDNRTLYRLYDEGWCSGKMVWESNFKLRDNDSILNLKIIYDAINYCLYITTPFFIRLTKTYSN